MNVLCDFVRLHLMFGMSDSSPVHDFELARLLREASDFRALVWRWGLMMLCGR